MKPRLRVNRPKVLVVDDSPIVLELVKDRLESAGFDVTVRSEPLGTSQWIATHRPDVVLLDVEMPALTGDALATLLSKPSAKHETRIIFHSSLPHERLIRLVKESGADGAVQKTDDDEAFLRELRQIIGPLR